MEVIRLYHQLKFRILRFPAGLDINANAKGLHARTVFSQSLGQVVYMNCSKGTLSIMALRGLVFDPLSA